MAVSAQQGDVFPPGADRKSSDRRDTDVLFPIQRDEHELFQGITVKSEMSVHNLLDTLQGREGWRRI